VIKRTAYPVSYDQVLEFEIELAIARLFE